MSARHPQTNRLVHECSRCDTVLNPDGEPVEKNAVYYVEADEERNPFETDVAVALHHTDETRALRDAYADTDERDVEQANNAMSRGALEFPGGVPDGVNIPGGASTFTDERGGESVGVIEVSDDIFDREEGVDPEEAKHDDDVVAVRGERIEVDRPAYLLICADCKRDGDRVEWAGRKAPHP